MKYIRQGDTVYALTNEEYRRFTVRLKNGVYPNFKTWLKTFRKPTDFFVKIDQHFD